MYVNEYLPADTDLNTNKMKTPFEFKIKAMTSFANRENTSYFHTVKVEFSSYYTHETINQKTQDLSYYVPTCHLNGFRIYSC